MGPYFGKHRGSSLTLTKYAEIVLTSRRALSLAEMQAQFVLFAELFILLTGSDFNLDWPTLTCRDGGRPERFQLYFARHARSSASGSPRSANTLPELASTGMRLLGRLAISNLVFALCLFRALWDQIGIGLGLEGSDRASAADTAKTSGEGH